MAKVYKNRFGDLIVKGQVTITIEAYLDTMKENGSISSSEDYDEGAEIPDEIVLKQLRENLEELACSNTGTELLANGKITIL